MFPVTKLTAELQAYVTEVTLANKTRSLVFSIALAKTLADSIDVPPTSVDDLRTFYNSMYRFALEDKLSQLNELFPISLDTVRDYVYKFYSCRYSFINPQPLSVTINKDYSIEAFFHINKSIDNATIDIIRTSYMDISKHVLAVSRILEILKAPEAQNEPITQ